VFYLKNTILDESNPVYTIVDTSDNSEDSCTEAEIKHFLSLGIKIKNLDTSDGIKPKSKLAFHQGTRYFLLKPDGTLRMYILKPDMETLAKIVDLGVVKLDSKTNFAMGVNVTFQLEKMFIHVVEVYRNSCKNSIYCYYEGNLKKIVTERDFKNKPVPKLGFTPDGELLLGTKKIKL
jgi:hypothetical protein